MIQAEQLTEQQREAVQQIQRFLDQPDRYVFTLTGLAGTGKTTVLRHGLSQSRRSIAYTATTHAASKVLEATLNGPKVTTTHKLSGVVLTNNEKGEKVLQKVFGNVKKAEVIVVDEASMLPEKLLKILVSEVKRFKKKIIFVGDSGQLPPVEEESSSALNRSNYELTQIVRQAQDNPIILQAANIRGNNIQWLDEQWNKETQTGLRYIKRDQVREVITQDYSNITEEELSNRRILCYTNNQANNFNNLVREIRFGKNAPKFYHNELLISNMSLRNPRTKKSITHTSELLRFIELQKSQPHPNRPSLKLPQIKLMGVEGPIIAPVVLEDQASDYCQVYMYLMEEAIHAPSKQAAAIAWKKLYQFSEACMTFFFKTLQDSRGQTVRIAQGLNYAYASTVHKAQGITFDRVYIDYNNMSSLLHDPDPSLHNKLLYTAITRPKLGLTIIKD